jgi:hypothetical protein
MSAYEMNVLWPNYFWAENEMREAEERKWEDAR